MGGQRLVRQRGKVHRTPPLDVGYQFRPVLVPALDELEVEPGLHDFLAAGGASAEEGMEPEKEPQYRLRRHLRGRNAPAERLEGLVDVPAYFAELQAFQQHAELLEQLPRALVQRLQKETRPQGRHRLGVVAGLALPETGRDVEERLPQIC